MASKGNGGSRMKKYIEFCDKENGYIKAVDELNKFIAENKHLKVSVVGYRVVRYERYGADRTYILVEAEE
jgi:hypothetical protein